MPAVDSEVVACMGENLRSIPNTKTVQLELPIYIRIINLSQRNQEYTLGKGQMVVGKLAVTWEICNWITFLHHTQKLV